MASILWRMARSGAKAPPPPVLHELEAEIMEEVWRQGETTVKRVMEALNRKAKPPRAYTTYMTTLSREEYQELRASAQVQGLVDEFGDVALAHFAKSLQTLDPARRRQL